MSRRQPLAPVAPRPDTPHRSERIAQIVEAARRIVEGEGADALTMRRLGDDLGIRAPSLYKHLPGRDAVLTELVQDALFESGDVFHDAVTNASGDPVAALLTAYREYGCAHPNLYRLVAAGELHRVTLAPGLEGWAGEPFFRVTGEPYRAQALWAFAHGALILEVDDRFMPGSELDLTWQAGAEAFA